jgi:outer membrane protein
MERFGQDRSTRRSRWCILCSAALVLAIAPAGQAISEPDREPPTRRYTISECIEMALSNHSDLREALWDVEIARMRVEEANRGGYPDTEYTQMIGVVNRARGNARFSPDTDTAFLEGLGPFTRLDLQVKLPIYTFGKISAGKDAALSGLETEEAKRTGRENEVIREVKELYFGLLLARQLAEVLDGISSNLEEAIEKVTERIEAGDESVSQRDALELRVGYAKLAQGAREVSTNQQLARKGLMRAMDLEPGAPFDTADGRLEPATVDLRPLPEYVEQLFENRPDWERLQAGIHAKQAQVVMAKSDYFPVFFLAGGVRYARAPNRRDQENPFVLDEFNYLTPGGVLGLHWSLNFGTTRINVETAAAELAKLRVQEYAARRGLPLEAAKAYAEVEQARDNMHLADDGRRAGRALLATSMSSFMVGVGNARDLFIGLGAYADSAKDYYRAVFDYNMALADLSKAIGVEVTTLSYTRPTSRLSREPQRSVSEPSVPTELMSDDLSSLSSQTSRGPGAEHVSGGGSALEP